MENYKEWIKTTKTTKELAETFCVTTQRISQVAKKIGVVLAKGKTKHWNKSEVDLLLQKFKDDNEIEMDNNGNIKIVATSKTSKTSNFQDFQVVTTLVNQVSRLVDSVEKLIYLLYISGQNREMWTVNAYHISILESHFQDYIKNN